MIAVLSLSPCVDKVYFLNNFNPGSLYRVEDMVKSAGGKGINVARVCSILNEEVNCIGFKAGVTGNWIEQELHKIKVETNFITVDGESRTNNNIIDQMSGTETEVLEIGPHISSQNKQEFMRVFNDSLTSNNKNRVLVCSGGLPKGIPTDFYRQIIDRAKDTDVKIILDSSGEMLEQGIKAKPNLIKPNLRELGELTGKKFFNNEGKTDSETLFIDVQDDIINSCRQLNDYGIDYVLVSMGKNGALLVTENNVYKAEVPNVTVVNTIGSGDSSVAGCAIAFRKGYNEERMLALAMACAVANTQFKEIGFVTEELVNIYLPQIKVTKREK